MGRTPRLIIDTLEAGTLSNVFIALCKSWVTSLR
jgi:hypothetical protein